MPCGVVVVTRPCNVVGAACPPVIPKLKLSATSTVNGNVETNIYPEDDFGGFCFWPDPLIDDGENEWELETQGMDANSQVVFTWEDRYQGV